VDDKEDIGFPLSAYRSEEKHKEVQWTTKSCEGVDSWHLGVISFIEAKLHDYKKISNVSTRSCTKTSHMYEMSILNIYDSTYNWTQTC
jgi:hypothetical protein